MFVEIQKNSSVIYTPYSTFESDLDIGSNFVIDSINESGKKIPDDFIMSYSVDMLEQVIFLREDIIKEMIIKNINTFTKLASLAKSENHIDFDEKANIFAINMFDNLTHILPMYKSFNFRYFESLKDYIYELCISTEPLNVDEFLKSGYKFGSEINRVITWGKNLSVELEAELVYIDDSLDGIDDIDRLVYPHRKEK